jgi:nitrous oxidase accessory protein
VKQKGVFILIAIALSLFTSTIQAAALKELSVCANCKYQNLTSALIAAAPGAIITVRGGHYREGRIVIEKSVTIRGEGAPVFDGEKTHMPFLVGADDVTLTGLTIIDSGTSYTQEIAGIRFVNVRNCRVENNRLLNNTYGIYLEKATGCRIVGNEISNTRSSPSSSEASLGNGIHLWNSSEHFIAANRISGHRDGIYLEFANDSRIERNVVERNFRYGLHFMSSNRDEYYGNTFGENGAGVAVMYSKDITMRQNRFIDNNGPASYGLLLKDITSSKIEENEFARNTIAIFMESSSRSKFKGNLLRANGWALKIMGSCEGNEFTRNDFLMNTFDVTTNSSLNANSFTGNYWSHYEGYDLGHDGVGDKPYRPVSLSSVIIERFDSSYILLNSFLLSLLDEVEQALPELIPELLSDERPAMKRTVGITLEKGGAG